MAFILAIAGSSSARAETYHPFQDYFSVTIANVDEVIEPDELHRSFVLHGTTDTIVELKCTFTDVETKNRLLDMDEFLSDYLHPMEGGDIVREEKHYEIVNNIEHKYVIRKFKISNFYAVSRADVMRFKAEGKFYIFTKFCLNSHIVSGIEILELERNFKLFYSSALLTVSTGR